MYFIEGTPMLAARARTSVLIVDNSSEDRESYRRLLRSQPDDFYTVMEADSAQAGLDLQRNSQLDCILLDYNLSDRSGVEFVRQIAAEQYAPARAIIMMMGPRAESGAFEAAQNAAHDCLVKGRVTAEALHRAIQRALDIVAFQRQIDDLRRELEQLASKEYMTLPTLHSPEKLKRPRRPDMAARHRHSVTSLGKSDEIFYSSSEGMAELMKQVERIAPQDTTIMLTGETGTGKTRLARQIHELSPRRDEPFIVINCGAISANLIESELFGHVRGAFTGAHQDRSGKFEAVGRGTLLLDEIDAMPIDLQAKLLRVVDERFFEAVGTNRMLPMEGRLIVASNRVLSDEVAAGRFRADLHFRLNVVEFHLLPLRERREMIPFLADHFFNAYVACSGRNVCGITDKAMKALEGYHWPGNFRQLRNVIERAVVLCPGQEIQCEDLPDAVRMVSATTAGTGKSPAPAQPPGPTISEVCEEAEINRIRQALQRHKNNRSRAASELGISRMTLYKKLHGYGLFPQPNDKRGKDAGTAVNG
jgi:DNA-binding NtrC family response regulator